MTARARIAFGVLLALYPRGFRQPFGGEMREVFAAQLAAARVEGRAAVVRLWLRTIAGMTAAAWCERRAGRAGHRRGLPWHETLVADTRLAARLLARAPLFAAIVVTTVSVGVGAVATIFSALNAVVLRPLPGTTDGGRLVGIDRRTPDSVDGVSASYEYFRYLAANARSFDGIAAWSRVALTIARGSEGFAVTGNIVSGNYFDVLGVKPAAGRFFVPAEDAPSLSPPVVVVSHAFWRRELAGDPSVVGSTVRVNGRDYRLIGVTPEGFHGVFTPIKIDAWVPLAMQPHVRPGRDLQRSPWLWVFGRLGDGVTTPQARAEATTLATTWSASTAEDAVFRRYTNVRLTPLTGLPDDARRALLGFGAILLGGALLVLAIAGGNVSSLLAARALSRRGEIAVRVALGATRARLVRQLLTETLALFLAGACGGTLIALAATAALERLPLPADAGLSLELSPDWRVLALSVLVSMAIGIATGAGPALRGVDRNPAALMRLTSAGAGRRTRAASTMIVVQVVCSLLLLTAAGLFLRSLQAGAAISPGFDGAGVVVSAFNTEAYGYDAARGRAFYDALRRALERDPAVEAVTSSTMVPLTFADSGGMAAIDAAPGIDAHRFAVRDTVVDRGYFSALRIPLLAGRDFADADAGAPPVAIVNETFARRAWGQGDAVGRTFLLGGRRTTVVGVARDSRYTTLDEPATAFVYLAMPQQFQSARTLFVRGRGGADPPATAIAARVAALDPSLPRPIVSTLHHETGIVLLPQRVAALVTGMLGGVGLLLAAVGLYGLVAHAISLRRREIGVRMALGAHANAVVRLMLTDSLRLVTIGMAAGVIASLLLTRVFARYLLTVSPLDPLAFGGAALLLTVITTAAVIPARRAGRVSPVDVLARD